MRSQLENLVVRVFILWLQRGGHPWLILVYLPFGALQHVTCRLLAVYGISKLVLRLLRLVGHAGDEVLDVRVHWVLGLL